VYVLGFGSLRLALLSFVCKRVLSLIVLFGHSHRAHAPTFVIVVVVAVVVVV